MDLPDPVGQAARGLGEQISVQHRVVAVPQLTVPGDAFDREVVAQQLFQRGRRGITDEFGGQLDREFLGYRRGEKEVQRILGYSGQ